MNYPGTTVTAEFTEQNFQFMKEWNLVQGILNPEWVQTNNENIKAIYALNPITKEYVRFYPNPENSKIGETNYMWESFARIGALWIYSDKEFSSNYWKFEDSPVESTSLFMKKMSKMFFLGMGLKAIVTLKKFMHGILKSKIECQFLQHKSHPILMIS